MSDAKKKRTAGRRLATENEFHYATTILRSLDFFVSVELLELTRKTYPECAGQPVVLRDLSLAQAEDQVILLLPGTYSVPRKLFETIRAIIGIPPRFDRSGLRVKKATFPVLRFDDGLVKEEINLDTYETTSLLKYETGMSAFSSVCLTAPERTVIETIAGRDGTFTSRFLHVPCSENVELVAFGAIRRLREGRSWALSAYGSAGCRKLDWVERKIDDVFEAGVNLIGDTFETIVDFAQVSDTVAENVYRHVASPIKSFVDSVFCTKVEPVAGSILHCSLYGAEHTGIYVGRGKIVELLGSGLIRKCSPAQFIDGTNAMTIYVACHDEQPLGSREIAKRAASMVGNVRSYKLVSDNCHQFTCGCITGEFDNSTNFFARVESVISESLNYGRPLTWRAWDLPPEKLFS